jgi:2-polyprenyl-3-methyl-5-hydroxy-6-metoxy-1,4-benzoquinol methylase
MAFERTVCRICGDIFEIVLDLGEIYPSAFIETEVQISAEPLTLMQCANCGFVQLKHTVNRDDLYREYWYKSSLNQSMLDALQDVVEETMKRAGPASNLTVLDIGANDGSMLEMFPKRYLTVGFDPALNLQKEAKKRCSIFINDYFSIEAYRDILGNAQADIITAIAMFYDLDNPHMFLNDICGILAKNGVFVIQMTDLVRMLKANAFDNICHEHVGYYSLEVLSTLLKSHKLEIFDIQFNDVNGGSIRAFIAREGVKAVSEDVQQALAIEYEYFAMSPNPFLDFANRVQQSKVAVKNYLLRAHHNDVAIYGLGASTKGNTLLQYWGIDKEIIRAIGEVNPEKYGRRTIGTEIPIVPESELIDKIEDPTIFIILPWHFADFFKKRLKKQLRDGLYILFPLPKPVVVADYGEMKL